MTGGLPRAPWNVWALWVLSITVVGLVIECVVKAWP